MDAEVRAVLLGIQRLYYPELMKNKRGHTALNVILIIGGILSAGMGLEGFLLLSHFIEGSILKHAALH